LSGTNPTRLDETVGPNESDCPEAILDLLTPTEYPYAQAWRTRCRENAAARRALSSKPRRVPARRSYSTSRSRSQMAAASIALRCSPIHAVIVPCRSVPPTPADFTASRTSRNGLIGWSVRTDASRLRRSWSRRPKRPTRGRPHSLHKNAGGVLTLPSGTGCRGANLRAPQAEPACSG
jgi:hypothetical protein